MASAASIGLCAGMFGSLHTFSYRAEVRYDSQALIADTALERPAKSPADDLPALRFGTTVLRPEPVVGILSGRQDEMYVRRLLDKQWEIDGKVIPFTAEVQDFFSTELALQAANAPRDWRRLAGRLGGSIQGLQR